MSATKNKDVLILYVATDLKHHVCSFDQALRREWRRWNSRRHLNLTNQHLANLRSKSQTSVMFLNHVSLMSCTFCVIQMPCNRCKCHVIIGVPCLTSDMFLNRVSVMSRKCFLKSRTLLLLWKHQKHIPPPLAIGSSSLQSQA